MSCIHYKFRSSLEYDTITFDGLAISLADLKKAIMAQKKFAKVTDFDLEVTNAQTKEEYKDENMQIPKNSSVIVRRIPTGTRSKAQLAADRADPYASGLPKTKNDQQDLHNNVSMKQNKVVDLVSSDASEDDKLKAMMSQAGEDWQPNHYVKGRGRGYNPSGPLPPNYVCYRCGKPGHFIRNCPTNGVKRTIGIPRTFNDDQDSGTTDDSNKDSKKDTPDPPKKLVQVPELDATKKERKVPSELQCPMCKNLLSDAVLIPCCGTSYCDECIRTYLLENEQVCPTCGAEDVSPDSLIINKQLRQAVNNFRNARPASPFVNSTTDKPTPSSTAVDKPTPNSTVDKPLTSSTNDKTALGTSVPESKPPPAKPEVKSSETSDKDKSEQKVSSTTSETSPKDVTETKEEEEKKKEGSPLPVLKTEVSSPRRDAEDHRDRLPPRDHIRTGPRPVGPLVGQHPGFGHHDHPIHRGPSHGPSFGHRMAEPMLHRNIPPEGALLVPPLRAPRPLLAQPHPGPLMAQPSFIGSAALGLHPVGIVQPLQPNLLGAPIPFGVNPPGLRAFENPRHVEGLPPMSEEEFYRYQRKMKLRIPVSSRSKRKQREKEPGDRHSRREKSSNRGQPGNFDDELSQYRALQRHRTRPRSRSRSYSRSSRSRSNSRSFSRSLSHSSRSLSKSPTPEDWDRSRTPSPVPSPVKSGSKSPVQNEEKKAKAKKRKKHHKHKHSKKAKPSETEDGESKVKEKEDKEKSEKKKSKSKKKNREKEKSSKSKKKAKEITDKSDKTNTEESMTEVNENDHSEREGKDKSSKNRKKSKEKTEKSDKTITEESVTELNENKHISEKDEKHQSSKHKKKNKAITEKLENQKGNTEESVTGIFENEHILEKDENNQSSKHKKKTKETTEKSDKANTDHEESVTKLNDKEHSEKNQSSKHKKKSKETTEKANTEESVTAELNENKRSERGISIEKEELDEPLKENDEQSKKLSVEEKEERVNENETNGKGIESTENVKSRKRKSEEMVGEDGSKKKKSKEKSIEKKHKKKKHKKKHKRHKKEREKRSSQSAEGNNDSTEETQEDSEEDDGKEEAGKE